jgi:MFS family permease
MSAVAATVPLVDVHPARWRVLSLLAIAELLGMSLWFAGSAVAGQLASELGIGPDAAAWLTTIVQFGFVCGTAVAALLNIADLVPSRWYFAIAALLASAANASIVVSSDFATTLAARFFTGFFLAGVYPPAMKMASTWFRSGRGFAIGTVVGALTVGKATPYLVHAIPNAGPWTVILAASACALVASLLVAAFYADGPYPFASRPFSWGLVTSVVRHQEWRLAMGGYLGHMFELYPFWTWIPSFLAASVGAQRGSPHASAMVSLLAFGAIAVGGPGCLWGGVSADRRGRERLVMLAMAASGSCAVAIPLFFGSSLWLLGAVAMVWGFFVVADSAQFSTLVTESIPPHAVGTALTLQTSIGFLLTMGSIQLIPPLAGAIGWRWAFPILALGPAVGIASIRQLVTVKRSAAERLVS